MSLHPIPPRPGTSSPPYSTAALAGREERPQSSAPSATLRPSLSSQSPRSQAPRGPFSCRHAPTGPRSPSMRRESATASHQADSIAGEVGLCDAVTTRSSASVLRIHDPAGRSSPLGRHQSTVDPDRLPCGHCVEASFRRIKHQWLFLNELDTISTVRRLVAFYVTEYNKRLPHSSLRGRTPDEVYFGTADDVPDQLARARIQARIARLESNRAGSCDDCLAAADA